MAPLVRAVLSLGDVFCGGRAVAPDLFSTIVEAPPFLGYFLRNDARDDVGCAAGWGRHIDMHGVLGGARSGVLRGGGDEAGQGEQAFDHGGDKRYHFLLDLSALTSVSEKPCRAVCGSLHEAHGGYLR